jgi:pimeloyl-ACP methyl ester carboxylesterase
MSARQPDGHGMQREGKIVAVGDVELNVLDAGQGPAVLLLHGFPDSGRLWRHQVEALTGAGYRVVVPDQRGFGISSRPADARLYHRDLLVADAIAVLDAAGVEQAALISHDWGAAVGWLLAERHPTRFVCHAAMSVGPLPAIRACTNIRQREMSWYTMFFQHAGVAEKALAHDDWRLFREWARHHPEAEHWIADLSRDGALTAGLNWYRANFGMTAAEPWTVRVPTLGLWSDGDAYLVEEQMITAGRHVDAPWHYERVEHASHWMMLDRPEHLNRLLQNFLRRHHPVR